MTNVRSAYLGASVSTASPARLLVMLCDRLVLDVTRGAEALAAGDLERANAELVHAQDIVSELRNSLQVDAWSGGPQLAAIYDFLLGELVRANVGKDLAVAEGCRKLATDLASTWREAAMQSAAV